jgi:hypothetical protein
MGDQTESLRKYGLHILVHPKYDFEQFPFCFRDSPPPAGLWVGFGKGIVPFEVDIMLPPVIETVPLREGFAAAVVDPSLKLEPQIKEMTARLLAIQKGNSEIGPVGGNIEGHGSDIFVLLTRVPRANP